MAMNEDLGHLNLGVGAHVTFPSCGAGQLAKAKAGLLESSNKRTRGAPRLE